MESGEEEGGKNRRLRDDLEFVMQGCGVLREGKWVRIEG